MSARGRPGAPLCSALPARRHVRAVGELTQASPRDAAGAGGDALSLRLVMRALQRCLPMLRPVRADLLRFASAVVVLGVIGAATGALLLDLHWTRVLQGEPLSPLEARLLALDPATSVHVEALSAATRHSVRDRELAARRGAQAGCWLRSAAPSPTTCSGSSSASTRSSASSSSSACRPSRCASTTTAASATPSIASIRTARW